MTRKFKRKAFFTETESFCNIVLPIIRIGSITIFWGKELKEMNTFIQLGCIKLIKSDSKDIYNVTKILFQINAVLFIKES